MSKLHELAGLIRSKNAGPFSLTYDILFKELALYARAKAAGVFNKQTLAPLLKVDPEQMRIFECDNALAFKITVPRRQPAGHPADGDLHGGQQFAPLMDIEIP